MKQSFTILILSVATAFLALPSATRAQTLTVDSVSATHFCAGDPVSVTFTATGTWGHKNAFTLQLSNDSGTFNNGFTYLGSIIDTAPGTFSIISSIPLSAQFSSHYRLRIVAAYPATATVAAGDIFIGEKPAMNGWALSQSSVAINDPFRFSFRDTARGPDTVKSPNGNNDTVYLDYGSGATPATRVTSIINMSFDRSTVTYSTGGWKTITVRVVAPGGCSISDTFQMYVFDCTTPVIPANAIIISSNTVFTSNDQSNKTFWVNPGVSLTVGDNIFDTIFAESGASISGQNGGQTLDVVYLQPYASSDPDFEGVVVYATGAGVTTTGPLIQTVECSDLSFNYSVAPPNSVMHINENGAGVASATLTQIALSPNPTNGIVALQGLPSNATITAMNVLGETVRVSKSQDEVTLDLSQLSSGTYYIRIASNGSVTTKKVVKE